MGDQHTQAPQQERSEPARAEQSSPQAKTPAHVYYPRHGMSIQAASAPEGPPLPRDTVLFLQRTIGNRAVRRILQRKAMVSRPGDPDEREADRVAEQVVRMPAPPLSRKAASSAQGSAVKVSRLAAGGEDERRKRGEEDLVQTKEDSGEAAALGPQAESQISSLRGGGEPLAESVRAFYEPRFGQDFGGVRVHKGTQAAEAARAVNARAYTTGGDIVFGSGEYAPETASGRQLLAHELTHVVQQSPSGLIQRDADDESGDTSYRTPEYYNLFGVITAKNNMQTRLDNLFAYQEIGLRVGDTVRDKLLAYSRTYRRAYGNYARAVRAARAEAQSENVWLGIVVGVALNVGAAFILPSTAAGWFALTAAEAVTAFASGAVQAGAGVLITRRFGIAGGDLEPGGLTPEAQELEVWRQVAALYRAAAQQYRTIQNMTRVISGADTLIGEIRVQIAGGVQTMTEEQALDKALRLVLADQDMARTDDAALTRSLSELREFEARISALDPESYPEQRMEQDIWILWMSELADAAVLDRDPIEDRLHAIHVLGPGSRLGVDFGMYTFWFEEDEARDAARGEAPHIRERRRETQPRSPV